MDDPKWEVRIGYLDSWVHQKVNNLLKNIKKLINLKNLENYDSYSSWIFWA